MCDSRKLRFANITTIIIMVITVLLSLACCYSLFPNGGALLTLIHSNIVASNTAALIHRLFVYILLSL